MCGISALFSAEERLSLADIQKMTAQIRHRGPDDEGYALFSQHKHPLLLGGEDTPAAVFTSEHGYCPKQPRATSQLCSVALGHRRLSILDLSAAGHQPMSSNDARYWITYNGEVYNYLELREELTNLGCRFYTHSDTEVILNAYALWGMNCLHRFNGMFAFAIYDRQNHQLFAARDRFGVKPLYYWHSPQGHFAMASEIKQFTTLPGWQAIAYEPLVFDYLTQGILDHTSDTLFSGVQQLRGGECLLIDQKLHPRITRWYQLIQTEFRGDEREASFQFYNLLKDSVRLRMRSDVDVGFCLSGGLDSSSIVCLATQLDSRKHKTFSACAKEKAYDERSYIDIVNAHCGVQAHYTYPSVNSLFETLPDIVWHQDEPFGSTSIHAQWQVFQLVKEAKVKVMLDGQGADEQLAGYHGFFRHRLNDLFTSLRWYQFYTEIGLIRQRHGPIVPTPLKAFRQSAKRSLRQVLKMRPQAAPPFDWLHLSGNIRQRRDQIELDSVNQQCYRQLTTSLPMLLRYEDRNSMAHSIESRTPFLDYRLVEFVHSLPSHYKIAHGVTKRVLREGMKGTLPESIRSRMDKLGFATPEEVWMKQQRPDLFLRHVDRAIQNSGGMIKPQARQLVDDILSGKKTFSWLVWRLINFGMWMERFGVHTQ